MSASKADQHGLLGTYHGLRGGGSRARPAPDSPEKAEPFGIRVEADVVLFEDGRMLERGTYRRVSKILPKLVGPSRGPSLTMQSLAILTVTDLCLERITIEHKRR